jgi:hypothetical protein
MKHKAFNKLLEKRIELIRKVLEEKCEEYSRNDDKLYNFKEAGRTDNVTPEHALWGMCLKQRVSVSDIVKDIDSGKIPSDKLLNEKIGDVINYMILLEALIKERKGYK